MSNDDLRQSAVEAIAAYMHHELLDKMGAAGQPLMMSWMKTSAADLMAGADRAIHNTVLEGRRRGIIP